MQLRTLWCVLRKTYVQDLNNMLSWSSLGRVPVVSSESPPQKHTHTCPNTLPLMHTCCSSQLLYRSVETRGLWADHTDNLTTGDIWHLQWRWLQLTSFPIFWTGLCKGVKILFQNVQHCNCTPAKLITQGLTNYTVEAINGSVQAPPLYSCSYRATVSFHDLTYT